MKARTRSAAVFAVSILGCGGGAAEVATPTPPTLVVTAADLRGNAVGLPPAIDPRLLDPYRTAGDKVIAPNGDVLTIARQTGQTIRASFKYCLDTSGRVANVVVLQSSNVPSYDLHVTTRMKRWAFKPVVLDGKPIEVCSAATFLTSAR